MTLHLLRLRVDPPKLMRFAAEQGLLRQDDEGFGYTLHAWLTALFGKDAPKPFRYFEGRRELLAYSTMDAERLGEHAQTFALPQAWATLDAESLISKPMPNFAEGRRLGIEVLACPVSRKENQEKDLYLRALDRLGDAAPSRQEVYLDWFRRQWEGAVAFEHLALTGFRRVRLTRRGGERRLASLERPQALFQGNIVIRDAAAFERLLVRGIGRHRAFGFGMALLTRPQ
ncbi:MAG TPA: type I-E CRISPR-associated protein Cas6/Cse3/CasE [Methylococcus sp.]|nr:type I-E CRISPR-associated protein Cas6/Cse3/CasE [Methylococcus sp.]